ncbi:glycosyltransferase [Pseudomonas xanthosomatis]|uniref:glycosyltransferase n=1 Tax=Pseudomonas xanthosomatis TaxID=2842356 RepID=UPI001C3D8D3C|nr:glycosyltransferase [Pseudomonas xanthosomatis]QXH45492.1 glycosyltransferase [Pseudomonas xanthosomatis]
MNPAPLVSLVIPACNPRFFRAALASALAQDYENLEIIVCDDSRGPEIEASVEELRALARHPLLYLRNPQPLGFAGNLQQGFEQSQGDYIKFLCDDDRLMADCVSSQVQLFRAQPEISLVAARRHLGDEGDHILPQRLETSPLTFGATLFNGSDLLDFFETRQLNFIGGLSCVLLRASDLRELLPALAPGFVALLDLVLFVCLLRRGHLGVTAGVHCIERLHPGQLSSQADIKTAAATEAQHLRDMFAARTREGEPFSGWVRVQFLQGDELDAPRAWDNLFLVHTLRCLQAIHDSKVGSDSDSFAELYGKWLACRQDPLVLARLMRLSEHWPVRPRIVPVVIDSDGDAQALQVTLDSIAGQAYAADAALVLSRSPKAREWGARVISQPLQADWAVQLNGQLAQLGGADWVYLLRAGDRLSAFSLMLLAERIVSRPQIACCYGDEGVLRDGESQEPVFKPDFNLDLMRGYPYTGRMLAFSCSALQALGGFAAGYRELAPHDLLWRLVEAQGPQVIEHIPEVLGESTFGYAAWLSSAAVIEENPQLLKAHLERLGVTYQLRNSDGLINQVRYLHAAQPLVTLVISVRDQLPALERCLESVLEKTAYPHYEVLIVDNASQGADIHAWLAAMQQLGGGKLRVLSLGEETSFATQQNLAAQQARGNYLLMLSPFAVVTEPGWLDALLGHGQRQEVGAVGAKLCDARGLVVQAGSVLGLRGGVASPFVGEPAEAGGYMQRLQVAQNYSAVTADCLLVRKALFDSVGGLNDAQFGVAFSDIDLGLRLGQAGYLVVWAPDARLVLDRPADAASDAARSAERQARLVQQHEVFAKVWMPMVARDPAYNINLALGGSGFCLEPGLKAGWMPFAGRSLPHVLALPMNTGAVGHYRVIQPLNELDKAGWVTQQQYFEIPTNVELERSAPDVVVVQGRYQENFVKEIERLKTFSKGFCIYELDDYVVDVPKKNDHLKHVPHDLQKSLRRGIERCDRLVVSTQALADALHGAHSDIRVMPNMLAEQLWTGLRSQRRSSRKPRVGWGGGTSHTGDLEVIAEVVKALANEVDWIFFGMCPPALRPYLKEFHPPVPMELYPAKLASLNLDLALAPLEFHIFNDCKSNLRLLEYGVCGYPVIVTDTRAYEGYLPCTRIKTNSTEEWLQAIRMHLADPDESYRQGDRLRQEVLRDYVLREDHVQHWYSGWMPG